MLNMRLLVGSLLVLLTLGMLLVDQHLAPFFPFLLVIQLGLAVAGCIEFLDLLGSQRRPQAEMCFLGVALLSAGNWVVHWPLFLDSTISPLVAVPWAILLGTFVGIVLLVTLKAMWDFRGAGRSLEQIALTILIVIYLGLLPCFFAQLRWLPDQAQNDPHRGSVALALAIFVPKCCDIGAYTTGRLIGRHQMTPVLSPKKTWEGAAGGLTLACVAAVGIDRLGPAPLLQNCWACELGFGLTVGVAGMLGDLAESMIKRDCQQKDASQTVPGFGGVLDVVDSVIFSAPVTYLWLVLMK